MVHLTNPERETIISFSAADTTMNIYTTDPNWFARIKKLGGKMKGDYACEAEIPKKWLRIQKPPTLSEERKKELAERIKKVNALKKTKTAK